MTGRGVTIGWHVALFACVSAGCVSAIPIPTETDAGFARQSHPTITLETLAQGRKLYIAKCGGCHHLYLPQDRTAGAWPAIVADMGTGSISEPDRALITGYLTTMAGDRAKAKR